MQLKNLVFVDGRNGLDSCFRDRIGGKVKNLSVTACYRQSCIPLVRADNICQFWGLKTSFALLEAASKI